MTAKPVIGVHTGKFHLDDALCCAMFRYLFGDISVLRSSELSVLESQCDIICDVGGIYDHSKKRYDHHQKGFNEKFDAESTIPHSASGLVYRHYGKDLILKMLPECGMTFSENDDDKTSKVLTPKGLQQCYVDIYKQFVEAVDGNDNGVSQFPVGVKPVYFDGTTLSARVARLNPLWNEHCSEQEILSRFLKASELAQYEFFETIRRWLISAYPAQEYFRTSFNDRFHFHPSGSILFVHSPWAKELYELEQQSIRMSGKPIEPTVYYVVGFDDGRNTYSAVAVNADYASGSFATRLPFPVTWRGLRDEELEKVCGVPGAKFCHNAGFLAVNTTIEGAKQMIEVSLKQLETK